jgi:hypothetical protein
MEAAAPRAGRVRGRLGQRPAQVAQLGGEQRRAGRGDAQERVDGIVVEVREQDPGVTTSKARTWSAASPCARP